ncbi:polyphosphate polymerase domain-containing protein [Adlercreutzia sp. R7]|uniref:Polyphosphate polymerase domain-containing protein n=1 Tax=Adlercreutzia wanghongyangiae TaxID=3111451 RepID=A0ABU6IEH4_9ACTN|nr:polyphosphate polymerase domain-containing protein [Adlercreutzia sp. R7]
MMAYNSVFKRVEKKYRITPAQRWAVEQAAGHEGAMAVDAYGRTRITSLYLDTPERAAIARSVEKPLYKEKLRLRAYGERPGLALLAAFGAAPLRRDRGELPLADDEVRARVRAACVVAGMEAAAFPVFFGIKKKFKGIVYKRRLALSLPAVLAFVSGLSYELACTRWPLADANQAAAGLAPATRQIARELTAAMDRWLPLVPSMGIACDREAWGLRPGAEAAFDADLRLTFDDRLQYLDCHEADAPWTPIIDGAESIMEVKSAGPYPPWLVRALSASEVYPTSFTKYGNAYLMASAHRTEPILVTRSTFVHMRPDRSPSEYRHSINRGKMARSM